MHFDVAQANWSNAGLVTKLAAEGVGYQDGFQVLSLNQSVAAIPEHGSWLLIAVGSALLIPGLLARRRER